MAPASKPSSRVGRYEIFDEFARGGMASVHLGRLVGPVGFARTVAIKRLHPAYASDSSVVRMFIDEARLTGRIRHPNVIPILDVVAEDGNLHLVMDYVQGLSLSRIMTETRASGERVPVPIACAIMIGVLSGLHAAHEATDDENEPLEIVHRDVSPQNVIVGDDGIPRVLDFGVAKATGRMQETAEGQLKGKLAYMSPEQLSTAEVDRRSDVFAASVVFWELLTGERLFDRPEPGATITAILQGDIAPPSTIASAVPSELDALLLHGLARRPAERFSSARDMIGQIEALAIAATTREVGDWLRAFRELRKITDPAQIASFEEGVVGTAPRALHALPEPTPALVVVPAIEYTATHVDRHPPVAIAEGKRPRRTVAVVAIASAVLIVALGIGIGVGVASKGIDRASASGPIMTSTSAPLASTAPTSLNVSDVSPPSSNLSPTSSGEAPLDAIPAPRPTVRRRPRAPKPAPPRLDCKVINPDGTFGYRPECLRR